MHLAEVLFRVLLDELVAHGAAVDNRQDTGFDQATRQGHGDLVWYPSSVNNQRGDQSIDPDVR